MVRQGVSHECDLNYLVKEVTLDLDLLLVLLCLGSTCRFERSTLIRVLMLQTYLGNFAVTIAVKVSKGANLLDLGSI